MSADPLPRRLASRTSTVQVVFCDPTPSLPTPRPLAGRPVPSGCSPWWADVSRYAHTALDELNQGRFHAAYSYIEHAINAARRALADRTIAVRMTLEGQNGSHPTRRGARALEAWAADRTEAVLRGFDADPVRPQVVAAELDALDAYLHNK